MIRKTCTSIRKGNLSAKFTCGFFKSFKIASVCKDLVAHFTLVYA